MKMCSDLDTEVSTKLVVPEENQTFSGCIDVLVIKQRLWVLIIEPKQSRFDVTSGVPQALSYLLSQPPEAQRPETSARFGMVTNGISTGFSNPLDLALSHVHAFIQICKG
jgi:hypothetical protein